MMIKNLDAMELLVWDVLQASMSVARLDDMLKAGVLTLLWNAITIIAYVLSKNNNNKYMLPLP
jgi:hypothetical protein